MAIQFKLTIYLMTYELNEEKILIADGRRLAQCAMIDIFTLGLLFNTGLLMCLSLSM